MTAAPEGEQQLHLIDASIYVFRAYYSMPPNFFDAAGNLLHALYGYASFLLDLRARGVATASVAFDESLTTCFRNEIYPLYKANRELPDENLKYQLQQCQRLTTLLGFHNLSLVDYEADDIIGTLAHLFGESRDIVIVTRDKDLGQLLRSNDMLWDFANDDYMGPDDVTQKFGVRPDQMADFLALAGDSVDNIPGAPGIGAKTAVQLIQQFGALEAILDNPEAVASSGLRGAKRLATILAEHADTLRVYRQITGIHCEIPLQIEAAELEPQIVDPVAIEHFCEEMQFSERLQKRFNKALA